MESLLSRLGRKPGYQRDVQKRMGVMPWQRAVPNTRDITRFHAGGMAREELAGQRHQTDVDIGKRRLRLSEGLHTEEMGLKREGLNIARKQGRLATGLSIANIGLQGLAGILRIRDANEKVRLINEAQQQYLDAGDMDNYYNARFLSFLF